MLEREKWELRRQAKEATDHATALRSQLDLKDNRMKELEAELAMVRPLPSQPPLQVPAVLGDRALILVHPRILKQTQAEQDLGGAGLGWGL